jgi:26S proteasome non-ATPase regulatory subunit 9
MSQQTDENEISEESALRQSLANLDIQRKSMEQEADAIYSELTTPPHEGVEPMGLDTPLVDKEGYPRGDVDIYRCRTLRGRFRVLKTDHKETMQKIDTFLQQLALFKNPNIKKQEDELKARSAVKPKPKFDPITGKWVVMNWDGSVAGISGGGGRDFKNLSASVSTMTENSASTASNSRVNSLSTSLRETRVSENTIPFARVNAVADDSPAEEAGLKKEDLIFKFANLNYENHNNLKAIASLVPDVATRQDSIQISVKRRVNLQSQEWDIFQLTLKPRPWTGRGLIGCHIVPN